VAADRSGEQKTRVWVRRRAALPLAYEGASLVAAEELARHALAITDRYSLGRLNALLGLAHVRAHQGRTAESVAALEEARRVFDRVASSEQISDCAIPERRMAVISSLLLPRLGMEQRATAQQAIAVRTMPATLPRFATHIELHRGLMLVMAGDRQGGVQYAPSAMSVLPREKHSQSLRLMLAEIQHAAGSTSTHADHGR
jgi:hypothetical protein